MFHTPAHKQLDAAKQGAQIVNPLRSERSLHRESAVAAPFDMVGQIMAYEDGQLDSDDIVDLFQHLIDTGAAWSLQGCYGRQAAALIANGHCVAR